MTIHEPVARRTHAWPRAAGDFYIEPRWCSERLFETEVFLREVVDPACGSGRIVEAARARHLPAEGWDLVNRGFPGTIVRDFLTYAGPGPENLVFNVLFNLARPFIERAIELARCKTAAIFPTASLNAARWLLPLPLSRVWLLSPRPSMPPGELVLAGMQPKGGRPDYCWLVFERGYVGSPWLRWLHRDGDSR